MLRIRIAFLQFLLLATSVPIMAADYGPVPMQPEPGIAPQLASSPGPVYSLGTPSPQRPPLNPQYGHIARHGASVQQVPPATTWSGYGFGGVPTYQWGYFGAHYRPVKVYHRGYYGHQLSYGYRRGY